MNADNIDNTDTPFSLKSFLGDDMDKAVSAAIKSWDDYVSRYPGQVVNKNFLVNNIALIHRLLEAVVPQVLQDNVMLRERFDSLLDSYETLNTKHLNDLVAMSGKLNVTVSCVDDYEDLERVLDKLATYGMYMEIPEPDTEQLTRDTKLKSPFWLFCATLPNDTLSPHLVDHDTYTGLMHACKNVTQVPVDESPLMAASDEVDGLLTELGLE